MYLILKTTFQKEEPKILICRDFKKVTYADFQPELNLNLSEPNSSNSYEYCTFDKSFVEVLDKHAPKKRKFLRDNHKPHVNKTLRSTIMQSTQLKIKAMKPRSKNDVIEYKRQHNLVVKLKKRCKKRFLTILKTKNKSKPFWSTSKPYFSNEHAKGDADILLIENNKILLGNRKVANVFNQSLKTLTYLNGQMNRNLTFLMKLT